MIDITLKRINELLILDIKEKPEIVNTAVYKLKLKKFADIRNNTNDRLVFKKTLTYPKYKKIISALENDSQKRSYNFIVSKEVYQYIDERELFIEKRRDLGISIKQKRNDILKEFTHYKNVLSKTMSRQLREKQTLDSFFMYCMKKSSNFSVPGSGKTASVLGVYSYLSDEKKLIKRIVMIGPKNSFNSWIDEFHACFGNKKELKVFNAHDSRYKSSNDKKQFLKYNSANINLFLFNYEGLNSILQEIKDLIDKETLLVFDEIHRIKAISGVRALDAIEVSKNAGYIISLTGTPIPNSYNDIRNLLDILYYDEYDEFFGFDENQLINPTQYDVTEINTKIQPFFCRTTKEQLFVPKANHDEIININTTEDENLLFRIVFAKYKRNMLVLIIRLLQLESNPKMLLDKIEFDRDEFRDVLDTTLDTDEIDYKNYSNDVLSLISKIDKTSKLKECISLAINLYEQDKPFIVWCVFRNSIVNIKKELEKNGLEVAIIYGSTEVEDRKEIIEKFRRGELDALITNPHTLAESVSLHTSCHDAIYFEYTYNLVHLLQSKDRIHRLGLPENQYTQYYFLQSNFTTNDNCPYSLDARIYGRLKEKENIMLEAIENDILEQLTTVEEDLKIIFRDLEL